VTFLDAYSSVWTALKMAVSINLYAYNLRTKGQVLLKFGN
jgi:hypothetical protein